MGLIFCRRCGKPYNRDIWDECPNCARGRLFGDPYPYNLIPRWRFNNLRRVESFLREGRDYVPRDYVEGKN